MLLRIIAAILLLTFGTTTVAPPKAYGQRLSLPAPGAMVKLTQSFSPSVIKGIKINPKDPLSFVFLMDPGQMPMSDAQKRVEYTDLIKYFLAALTTPEKDMWVNLSPYEHNRITSSNFGQTQMGRDMLGQDYLLKQLTASLVYPEEGLGKKFWDNLYTRINREFGNTQVPVNTFNKVWVVPQSATIFEKGNVVMVTQSHLKVLMEEDYLSLDKHANAQKVGLNTHSTSSAVMKEVIIPEIEREINEGKNFAKLRQMYHSMILASWFKGRLKQHLLTKVYANQNKKAGVELKDPQENEQIYQQYIQAFKKGVYNYIKEETDPATGITVPRKYFSGGTEFAMLSYGGPVLKKSSVLPDTEMAGQLDETRIRLEPVSTDHSMAGYMLPAERLKAHTIEILFLLVVAFFVGTVLITTHNIEKLNARMPKPEINSAASFIAHMAQNQSTTGIISVEDWQQGEGGFFAYNPADIREAIIIYNDGKVEGRVYREDKNGWVPLSAEALARLRKMVLDWPVHPKREEQKGPKKGTSGASINPKTVYGGIDFDDRYLEKQLEGPGMDQGFLKGFDWLINKPLSGLIPKILDIHSGFGFSLSFFDGIFTKQQRFSMAQKVLNKTNFYGREVLAKL